MKVFKTVITKEHIPISYQPNPWSRILLETLQSLMNPIQTLKLYFPKTEFNIFLRSTLRFFELSLPFRHSNQIVMHFIPPSATGPAHLILFYVSSLTLGKEYKL
jgi:hypothetical protein